MQIIIDIGSSPDLLIELEEYGKQLVFYGPYGVNNSIPKVCHLVL